MDAVEACQSVERSYPQISVRCLSNAADLVFRHAIIYRPNLEAVLSMCRLNQTEENYKVGNEMNDAAEVFKPPLAPNAEIRYMLPAWLRHQLLPSSLATPI